MQDQLSAVRSKTDFDIAGPLPFRNVDTGMGLERMAAILQGVDNIYEIDTTWKILDRAAELTEQRYGQDPRADVALKVVADHVRASVMLVDDGVLPSNEGRGYVLRRLLRRSIRNLRMLSGGQRGGAGGSSGGGEHYLHDLGGTAIEAMAPLYPELRRDAANIFTVLDGEEAAFLGTLRTGTAIFDAAMEETRRKKSTTLFGDQAFQLHDTYGFPIELTLEMAGEQGLAVDEEGFRRLMAAQRERAKADAAQKKTGNADISVLADLRERTGAAQFTGYDHFSGEATVVGLLVNDLPVTSATQGEAVSVVLDRTPFYAESGGQLPDGGLIVVGSAGGDPGQRDRGLRRPDSAARAHRAPGQGPVRRGHGRLACVHGDRHRPAPGHLPLAYRDPPGAPGDPRRARRRGRAGRVGERARTAAIRLHRARRGTAFCAGRDRGRG